jgi:hypothetical protein
MLRAAFATVASIAVLVTAVPTAAFADPTMAVGVTSISPDGLPMITTVQADGVVLQEVEPAALEQLLQAAATSGCGSACDAKDPKTYVYQGPGGPSQWTTCSADAVTVRSIREPGGSADGVDLRYSPRCRTAWARKSGEVRFINVRSYFSNGNIRTAESAEQNNYTLMLNDAGFTADACYSFTGAGYWPCTTKY